METMTLLGGSLISGIISLFAFYYSLSKKSDEFYKATYDSYELSGLILIVGWIILGLHKLYKLTMPNRHILALKITIFIFGVAFLAISIFEIRKIVACTHL